MIMDRSELHSLTDQLVRAVADSRHNPARTDEIVQALGVSEEDLKDALTEAERRGWLRGEATVLAKALPHLLQITRVGMQRADMLHGDGPQHPIPVPVAVPQIVYNLHGHNPRVVNGSQDSSINIVNAAPDQLFAQIQQTITEKVTDIEARTELLERARALQAAPDSSSRTAELGAFLAAAANWTTILGPFFPALTQYINS